MNKFLIVTILALLSSCTKEPLDIQVAQECIKTDIYYIRDADTGNTTKMTVRADELEQNGWHMHPTFFRWGALRNDGTLGLSSNFYEIYKITTEFDCGNGTREFNKKG